MRKSRQAACAALATSLLVLTTYQRKPGACTSAPALLLLLSGTPLGSPLLFLPPSCSGSTAGRPTRPPRLYWRVSNPAPSLLRSLSRIHLAR